LNYKKYAITSKRYEIGCQLVLIINKKSHTCFRLVPTSVTLNDLEPHNSRYIVFFPPNSIALQADYGTVVEDKPIMSAKYRIPVPFFHLWPKLYRILQRVFSAIAELVVRFPM